MDEKSNLILINNIIEMLNFLNFRNGTQNVDYYDGQYVLTGQNRTDNTYFAFDFDKDGTILGTFRKVNKD